MSKAVHISPPKDFGHQVGIGDLCDVCERLRAVNYISDASPDSSHARSTADFKKFLSSWHEGLNISPAKITSKAFVRTTRPNFLYALVLLNPLVAILNF